MLLVCGDQGRGSRHAWLAKQRQGCKCDGSSGRSPRMLRSRLSNHYCEAVVQPSQSTLKANNQIATLFLAATQCLLPIQQQCSCHTHRQAEEEGRCLRRDASKADAPTTATELSTFVPAVVRCLSTTEQVFERGVSCRILLATPSWHGALGLITCRLFSRPANPSRRHRICSIYLCTLR